MILINRTQNNCIIPVVIVTISCIGYIGLHWNCLWGRRTNNIITFSSRSTCVRPLRYSVTWTETAIM